MTAVDPSPAPSAEAAPVRLVLASASPARRKLLEDSRIAFTVRVSSVDEDAALAAANERARAEGREGLSPAETASLLASLKARAVAEELAAEGVRDALVLGCDSVFEFEGRAYGKPHTAENARERITAMSGHHGTLHTGHALVDLRGLEAGAELSAGLPAVSELRSAVVHFDELSPAEVDAYIATGEPLWVAGSFTLDGYGSAFIRGIEGEFHTVVGLSIHALRDLLRRRGVAVTDLWLPPES
ncbi:Maf family protein [Rothia mucilaginosa]|uniref:Maf family protein n=1 Tax=Rothia mucilaginosa TaxID=43675 RepID=UPI00195979C2|nr:nucleoside triphosphate pyrophosphatase [Rothia mucilaginosa]MBS6433263.1 septum formation inhibitor Maf [Rothia mucilaginosa]VTY05926.1 Maf-like protein [Rothia mucilaginosa]